MLYKGRSQTRWTLPAEVSPSLALDCSVIDTFIEERIVVIGKGEERKRRRVKGQEKERRIEV